MNDLAQYLSRIPVETFVRIVAIVIPLSIALIVGNIVLSFVERAAVMHAGKHDHEARARYAVKILRYLFAFLAIAIGAFMYAGSWTGLGIGLSVLVAAMGFALQRPAASIAGWITILFKKPFLIGDRISIGTIAKGDVVDLTLTHITLAEVGRWGAEDVSGRTVLVPNNMIFDYPVTRYGNAETRIMTEVEFTVTFDSDLARARTLAEGIATEAAGKASKAHTRVKIAELGILIEVRFTASVQNANRMSSEVTERILEALRDEKAVALAYSKDVRVVEHKAAE